MSVSQYVTVKTGPCDFNPDPTFKFSTDSDDFQKHGYDSIFNDYNTFVQAPTGCGKTRNAIFAIADTIQRKHKTVIYTTPVKALSNQKYNELRDDFAHKFKEQTGIEISVGIMTGDNKINPDADVVVMTTEILRNALYKIGDQDTQKWTELSQDCVARIGCVIFDEVHYINDKDRGHVWEETIRFLDPSVNLVMLSATIDKAEQFAAWIGEHKKKMVTLVSTHTRVIPLQHYIYTSEGLHLIMDSNNRFIDSGVSEAELVHKQEIKDRKINKKFGVDYNKINRMITYLKKHHLLQTIFFSFSRANCERYAKTVSVQLVSPEDSCEIRDVFDKFMKRHEEKYNKSAQFHQVKNMVQRGVAFHHSGLIPILKEIIEILFSKGLVKVLFATETFAVGVNMPTRTIVFTETEKPTNTYRRSLEPAEYKQMAGRAGRRGLDKNGTVIILPLYSFPSRSELYGMMSGKMPEIKSKFSIDYSFVLKILLSQSMDVGQFIEGSLFNRENLSYLTAEQDRYQQLQEELDHMVMPSNDKLDQYLEAVREELRYKEMGVTLNKKQMKKMHKLRKQVTDQELEQYEQYRDLQREVENSKVLLDGKSNYLMETSSTLLHILNQFGFVSSDDGQNITTMKADNVNLKGIVAAQINECNPLLLSEILFRGLLNDLSPQEIVGVLAVFVDDAVKPSDRRTLSEISDNTVKSVVNQVIKIIQEFMERESQINFHNDSYWNIYYDFVNHAFDWSSGHDLDGYEGYEGNFVKNILKISNLVRDLECLCRISGEVTILPQLEQINGLIIRDIVAVDSLYL